MREQWEVYMETTEGAFHKNISSIEQKRSCLVENLQQCKTGTELCSEQWSNAQKSVLALGRSNAETISSVISDGNEANSQLHMRFSSAVSTAVEDNDISSKALVCSIDDSLRLDGGICETVKPIITASQSQLCELQRSHHEKTLVISGSANRSLGDDYKVDEPTCSTPRRRQINIPSSQSIEGLVTPLEDLVKSFWDSRTPSKLVTGNMKRMDLAVETESSSHYNQLELV